MEQSEYRSVADKLKAFEEQLASCDVAINECEQSGREEEQKIEDHFSQCLTALVTRKDTLLREVAQEVYFQRQKVEASRATLVSAINACRNTLHGATLGYSIDPSAIETLNQELTRMSVPTIVHLRLNAKFQNTFLKTIHTHGEIGSSCRFSRAVMVTTFAGSVVGNEDGHGQNAKINNPWGMCFNPNDNCLYFTCRSSNTIKRLTLQGQVGTFVSSLSSPTGIAIFNKENTIYVVNQRAYTICKINPAGTVSVFAGGQMGSVDAIGTFASFNLAAGIAVDQITGNIYVADQCNNTIRKISPQGIVLTVAGSTLRGCVDDTGVSAKFRNPYGVCIDESDGSLLVCDYSNNKLRRVRSDGKVTTLCEIPTPRFITLTQNGSILVTSNNRIYKVTASQGNYRAEVIAVTRRFHRVENAEECCLNYPNGIVANEESHSCFVADGSHTIQKVSFV